MTQRDYYEILGISRDATDDEIKKAYRKLAMQYHPDRNTGDSGAEEKFKEASEAYEVLRDAQKRQRYNAYGHAGVSSSGFGAGGGGIDFDLSDALRTFMSEGIFGDFFGMGNKGGGRGSQRQQGSDLKVRVALTLEEVARGVTKKIKLKKLLRCDECEGTGARSGSSPATCNHCSGTGEVRNVSRSIFGQFINVSTCPHCNGEGQIVKDACRKCKGGGRVKDDTTLTVDIPAGVSTGNYLTVRNEGNAGPNGGPPGDCIILIEEKQHKNFERHGDDILYDLPLSFPQATLGDTVEVPTLEGRAALEISPATQSGKILRMRGKGVSKLNGHGNGDQLVRILVWTPTKLSSYERDLLKKLAKAENIRPPQYAKSILDKIKDAFTH